MPRFSLLPVRKSLILFLVLAVVTANLLAQNAGIGELQKQAEAAALRDLGFPSWNSALSTVCLLGFRESALRVPVPPAERFIGKSAPYISEYSKSYKQESRAIRNRYTGLSCCAGFIMGITLTGCLLIMNAESYGKIEE
jgi:hypothetical protein